MNSSPRYALVTGASSDVGAAVARTLAATGHSLWLTHFSSGTKAQAVAQEYVELGIDVRVSHLDLRSPESIQSLRQEVDSQWGQLDVLVNNAAASSFRSADDLTVDEWDEMFETNTRGTFLASREFVPLLRRQADAHHTSTIINVAGISGQVGALQAGMHYAASKAAVLAITRSYARLLASEGIRVNAVSPGPLDTSMVDHVPAERKRTLGAALPLGRFGTPREVAWIVGMLASPEASFVTGATYDVNGGARID